MGRSTRGSDAKLTVEVHADDYHRVVGLPGWARWTPSGRAAEACAACTGWSRNPEDVETFVSHEPPVVALLEDREIAVKVNADIVDTYQREGFRSRPVRFPHGGRRLSR
ncbi:MAG: hypothetical protein JO148_14675 [Acidimicrobiia bacterium]|nr:hypothetical protein [Acidimicrobiia bacterium]